MSINLQERYHGAVIGVQGKFLGSRDGVELKEMLEKLKESGTKQVVVDLAETDFMDSSAIGALIGGMTTMRKSGGDLRLANMEQRVKNLFAITRLLGPVFVNYESVEEALNSYSDNPPPPVETSSVE